MNKKELPERIIGRFWSIINLSLAIPYSTSTENLVLLPQSEQYEGGHEWAFTQPSHVASLIFYFSNTLSAVNINNLGLYKAFWYTGSAFTRYFNHNHNNVSYIRYIRFMAAYKQPCDSLFYNCARTTFHGHEQVQQRFESN